MNIPDGWTESDIDLSDGVLHCYRAGRQNAPQVLLLHGFSDTGLCWIPTANALSGSYDLIMPDARGHGRSARLIQGGEYDLVQDVIGIIEGMPIERPIVFGHSMGALAASQLAARRPDLVRALVLIDPPWHTLRRDVAYPTRIDDTNMGGWVRMLPDKTKQELMQECRRDHPTWPDVIVESWCEGKKQLDQNVIGTTLAPVSNLPAVIEAICCPTLLFTADPDLGGIVTPELAAAIEQMNPRFITVRIRNTGHHLNFSHHDEYMNAVNAFLASLPS